MEYGAIDLHTRKTLIRIVDAEGRVVLDRSIRTTRGGLVGVVGAPLLMRVLLETGTESEWVAQTIEGCGHEVVVADPNYALMYGVHVRAVKTDRRDVAALAEACRLGIYRAAHRVSAAQRQVRRQLRVRDQLIRMRTQAINLLRAQLRQAGYRLPSGASPNAATRCRRLALSPELCVDLAPVLTLLDALAPLIKARDQEAETQAVAESRWWRSRAGSPGSCMRCGATAVTIDPCRSPRSARRMV